MAEDLEPAAYFVVGPDPAIEPNRMVSLAEMAAHERRTGRNETQLTADSRPQEPAEHPPA
ncbi:hypothetical protein G4Z16_08550 [Streptomyces bathyalis]|uniref:Uncharacterized protein n=1 Tax=Streptomyces bathyalis TaxID=2710756 RepID=A0A7T1T4V5_9ACTN|nr:hypothetical protein [Streptomyces bathyalis]QPP06439.1 hypothetical protein G4Z16_08550 [Streptomyces bathyalis]